MELQTFTVAAGLRVSNLSGYLPSAPPFLQKKKKVGGGGGGGGGGPGKIYVPIVPIMITRNEFSDGISRDTS